jgi:CheY-like chemotaxis protein
MGNIKKDPDSAVLPPNKTIPELRAWSNAPDLEISEISDEEEQPAKGRRFLILGDDPARLDALAQSLRGLDAEVRVGDRVLSGFSEAARFMPDAIISDLISPGEPGWELVRRFRRHPVLRWTPVLLLRWWAEEPNGEKRILLASVLKRLAQTLEPLDAIQKRMADGSSLGERVDATGAPALLRLLVNAGVRGLLTVNDAWSVFEMQIDGGGLHSVRRRGVDGCIDEGEAAFLQLLLCDTGRWSFQTVEKVAGEPDIGPDFEIALGEAGQILTALFAPSTDPDSRLISHIGVRIDLVRAVADTMSSTAELVAENIGEGHLSEALETLLTNEASLLEIDRALRMLIRCGAIRPQKEGIAGPREDAEQRSAACALRLLRAIAKEKSDNQDEQQPTVHGVSDPPGDVKIRSEIEPDTTLPGRPVPGGNRSVPEQPERSFRHKVRDSLVPAPDSPLRPRNWGTLQTAMAIALAVLLLSGLIAGLVLIGSDHRDGESESLSPVTGPGQ